MTNDDKTEVVENCLYRLKERSGANVAAIDNFMAGVGADALADLYDLIRFHDGGPTTVQLDADVVAMVDHLASLRAAIANHRLASLVAAYPELAGDDTAQPAPPVVTIRMAVQREAGRLEQVAKDCGLERK